MVTITEAQLPWCYMNLHKLLYVSRFEKRVHLSHFIDFELVIEYVSIFNKLRVALYCTLLVGSVLKI